MAKTIDEQSKSVEVADKKTFTLDRLRTDCLNLFSVASATFDGATSDMDKSKEYTVDEVRNHIDDWKKKGVK